MEKKKVRWGDRRDGVWLRDIDPLHVFTPYLMPNRADNEAFIEELIDLTEVNTFLEQKNREDPEFKYTFFHVILAALVKTITLRPRMNRFISGNRMYQRNELTAAFVMKKQFSDTAKESLLFIKFEEDDTVTDVHNRIKKEVLAYRNEESVDNSTAGMDFLGKLPRPLLRFVIRMLYWLEYHGRAPLSLVKTDPDYATIFISNLGSIKLNAAYHHLNNWGTNSVFVTIGEKHLYPYYDADGHVEMRDALNVGITLDERIADGYYYSKTIKLFKHLLQHPELLERPAKEEVEYE
ncbi:2-oxo acid dehydrogenase subunit E2 [Oscillibacter hominis]|uniref:2-oxo acid dehydrogenase subunit E2 n=1 Tax=Oscillibacter hominis TaxID=2763056 RepID=A0A7G9B5I5_9FIRM|nr:2-oxo acid dehydrogenase subunit E2 [Oscillibacter hominis]QNL44816.1 2-oxo acid dehydrogenase subunit E2 [Oscillibacter hominis]